MLDGLTGHLLRVVDGAQADDSGCSAVADCPGHPRPAPLRAQRAPGRTLRRTATKDHTHKPGHRPGAGEGARRALIREAARRAIPMRDRRADRRYRADMPSPSGEPNTLTRADHV